VGSHFGRAENLGSSPSFRLPKPSWTLERVPRPLTYLLTYKARVKCDLSPPRTLRACSVVCLDATQSNLGLTLHLSFFLLSTSARLELPAPQQRVRERERGRDERERVDAHRNPVGESVCLSVGVCEGGGVRPPPRERVSRAVAEGRRAECVW